mgnify:FL=1
MDEEKIMVSILCLAYNHEKYIKDALDSFINQKVNFKYEIIINDDCSTDSTAQIIKEYAERYPQIIKPIFQKENQYSKYKRMLIDILMPQAKGKYFAICEGDDYWTDPNKLQKQFDFMEANSEYSMCVANAIIVDSNKNKVGEINTVRDNSTLACDDFILGGGGYVATNSIFSRMKYIEQLPTYFNDFSIDYLWQIFLSSMGKTYCFKEPMVAYRINTGSSWTDKIINDESKNININKRIVEKLKEIDECTNKKYDDAITEKITELQFNIFYLENDFEMMKQEPYLSYKKRLTKGKKIKILIKEKMPFVFKILKKEKLKIKHR